MPQLDLIDTCYLIYHPGQRVWIPVSPAFFLEMYALFSLAPHEWEGYRLLRLFA